MAMCFLVIASISLCSTAAVHLTPVSESKWDDRYFKNVPQDLGRPVFYSVIMGELTKRNQVNTVVGSLRQVGEWMGPIIIVTDSPVCIAEKLVQAGLIRSDIKPVSDLDVDIFSSSVPPSTGGSGNRTPSGTNQSSGNVDVDISESFSGTVHIVNVPPTTDTITMKKQKALAWTQVGRAKIPDVSHIIYMDEDIVVGTRLGEFMRDVSWSDREHTLAVFDDKGETRGEPHTGVIVMSPFAASIDCLGNWSKALEELAAHGKSTGLSDLEGPDQRALMHTAQCNSGAGLKILNTNYLLMPTVEALRAGKTSTFVHFTNTHRWNLIPGSETEHWMYDVIGLSRALDGLGQKSCAE